MSYPSATLRLEFPNLFEGAFIELRHPARLSWGEQQDIIRGMDESTPDERTYAVLAHLITATNLPPVDSEDDTPLSIPVSPADFMRLPAVVVGEMLEAVNRPNRSTPSTTKPTRTTRSSSS